MLTINVPEMEYFDNSKSEFIVYPSKIINLEHSLVSISKWESKWLKPFLVKDQKTPEETIDYIKCMCLDYVEDHYIDTIVKNFSHTIIDYINSPMTATTIKKNGGNSREIVTSELVYYWMVSLNIPLECDKWHINRLLTLINVCDIKNSPSKKMSKKETLSRNASLNASRKKALCTSG